MPKQVNFQITSGLPFVKVIEVELPSPNTTIASASNGQVLPQATINVASTTEFPNSGSVKIQNQIVTYTGKTSNTFTGCSGGTVTLATGNTVISQNPTRTWWLTGSSFEVLGQIREAADEASPLILDLKQFFTVVFTAPNTVTITIRMNGEDTRRIKKSGYYDILISDLYAVDANAVVILKGNIFRDSVVTADQQAVT